MRVNCLSVCTAVCLSISQTRSTLNNGQRAAADLTAGMLVGTAILLGAASSSPNAVARRSASPQRVTAALHRSASPQLNFFANLMKPQPSPADVYNPDPSAKPAGFPRSVKDIYASAANGLKAALADGVAAVEIDFPPIENVNARGDGSAKSERLIHEANAKFIATLKSSVASKPLIVGCSPGALKALGDDAVSLRDAKAIASEFSVAICVAPSTEEQWAAATALSSQCVCVVNGLLENGLLPHAYYYKPMTAFSAQTGGVVRRYPGAYECYDISGRQLADLEIPMTVQGRRALPDTKLAQLRLQNEYGSRR